MAAFHLARDFFNAKSLRCKGRRVFLLGHFPDQNLCALRDFASLVRQAKLGHSS